MPRVSCFALALPLTLALPASPARPDDPPAARADPDAAAIAALLEPIRVQHGLPALGGAIVRSTGPVAVGATGVRRHGVATPVTAEDPWHLGSCTKAMTATLVAGLVEEKRLRFDTTVGAAFPDLRDAMDPGWRGVRLDWLCQNRGGAPADLDADGLWGRLWAHPGPPEAARRALVAGVVTRPPVLPPGTTYLYANAGFAIAGAMAEGATGKPWETLLRDRVFAPLGMTGAGFGAPGTAAEVPDAPWGHRPGAAGPVPVPPGPGADNPPAIGPAGTVHAPLADWARFVACHLAGARGKPRLLPAASFETLHRAPEGQEYAMGWGVTRRPWAGGHVLTHSGSNTMWFCVTWVAPAKDLAVCVTCNLGGDGAAKACDAAAWALIQRGLALK